MKVVGFSFIKNAEICDYPIREAIQSILPLCDEVIIAVGKSNDNTLALVQRIHPEKIKIIETIWDENLREGGRVLAVETDKAFQAIDKDADWCFYIQADEIVHENSLSAIQTSMLKWKDDYQVEGLLVDFIHFYGSYNYVADAYNWYRKEVRIVRNKRNITSWGDAQGFRTKDGKKLRVKETNGVVHHYGYVKPPTKMLDKTREFIRLWHNDDVVKEQLGDKIQFDYNTIDSLKIFEGSHPALMIERISRMNWPFEFDTTKNKMKFKYKIRRWIEQLTGVNIGEYKNYKLI